MVALLVSNSLFIQSHKGEYKVNFTSGGMDQLNDNIMENAVYIVDTKICDLYANNITVIKKDIGTSPTEIVWDVVETNKDLLFKKHSQVAVLYVSNYVKTARANSITIFDRKDFWA